MICKDKLSLCTPQKHKGSASRPGRFIRGNIHPCPMNRRLCGALRPVWREKIFLHRESRTTGFMPEDYMWNLKDKTLLHTATHRTALTLPYRRKALAVCAPSSHLKGRGSSPERTCSCPNADTDERQVLDYKAYRTAGGSWTAELMCGPRQMETNQTNSPGNWFTGVFIPRSVIRLVIQQIGREVTVADLYSGSGRFEYRPDTERV